MTKRLRPESPDDVQDRVLLRLQTEGVEAAAEGLIGVCRDPKATAQSKATAGRTIFEAAGLLDKNRERGTREVHEMSAEELADAIANLEVLKASYAAGIIDDEDDDDDDDGVFV